MSEQDDYLINKEKRILAAMRKTLSSIVKEVTPSNSSLKSPLSQSTTDDIIMCFGLITAREQEIEHSKKKQNLSRPQYVDQVSSTQTISIDSLKASLKK